MLSNVMATHYSTTNRSSGACLGVSRQGIINNESSRSSILDETAERSVRIPVVKEDEGLAINLLVDKATKDTHLGSPAV